MRNIYFMASLATLLLVGCGKDDGSYKFENSEPGSKAIINGTINEATDIPKSRAANQFWAVGDKIGITCLDSHSPNYDQKNFGYTTSSVNGEFTAITPSNEIWFLGANTFQVSAYYPYTGAAGIIPNIIEKETNTENQLLENQPNIDFLVASTTASRENPCVDLTFFHKMSRLVIQFKSQQGPNGEPLISDMGTIDCYLMKVIKTGNFNPITGIATADEKDKSTDNNIRQTVNKENGYKLSLILYPQPKINAQLDAILINADNPKGIYYKIPLENLHLEAGRSYNYTITAKATADNVIKLEINEGTITDWTEMPDVEVDSNPGRVQTTVEGTDINEWEGDGEVDVETKDAN